MKLKSLALFLLVVSISSLQFSCRSQREFRQIVENLRHVKDVAVATTNAAYQQST